MKTLYRPVGLKELQLIEASDFIAFPPRLDWQPIFYPVLHQAYARDICQQWNINDEFSGYCGFVTTFDMYETYLQQFDVQNVGLTYHEELWIPAERLAEFNAQIIGKIRVVEAFYGKKYGR